MENGQQIIKRITLRSKNGQEIDISEKEARLFGTLKDMLIDTQGDESPVPVSMSGRDLQEMVQDIPWIRKIHAAHNQNIDDIVQLDRETRKERARQSVENIDQMQCIDSDKTLQEMLERVKAASFLDDIESVEKNAKIISELLVSKNF